MEANERKGNARARTLTLLVKQFKRKALGQEFICPLLVLKELGAFCIILISLIRTPPIVVVSLPNTSKR